MHFEWLSNLDIKLRATAILLILPGTLALVIAVALVTRSRYLANVSLFGPFQPFAKIQTLYLLRNLPLCFVFGSLYFLGRRSLCSGEKPAINLVPTLPVRSQWASSH